MPKETEGTMQMTFNSLYKQLRKLVADDFAITIVDKDYREIATVVIKPTKKSHPWTRFRDKTIEKALERAIQKLENPSEDYFDYDGNLWKADETSIFYAPHITGFLRRAESVTAT